MEWWVCFHLDQSSYSFDDLILDHKCGVLYSLELFKIGPNENSSRDLDPITNCEYSVSCDFAMFKVLSLCICGKFCDLPLLHMPVLSPREISVDEELQIIGFMGPINEISSPLKALSEENKNLMCERLKPGKITISEGKSLRVGNLIAINNSTTPGFSGSPVLAVMENGIVCVVGVFVGGPAVYDHKILLEIASKSNQGLDQTIVLLRSLDLSIYPILGRLLSFLKRKNEEKNIFYYSQKFYMRAIALTHKMGFMSKSLLNHNLMLPLSRVLQ